MTTERLAVIRGTLEMRGRLPRDMATEVLDHVDELRRVLADVHGYLTHQEKHVDQEKVAGARVALGVLA